MKQPVYVLLFLFFVARLSAQNPQLQVLNNAVQIQNAEFVLQNHTASTQGYLFNSGGGVTSFTDVKTIKSAAFQSGGLGIENARLITSWAATSATSNDHFILNAAVGGSSPVTYTLPAAGSVNSGCLITIADASGSPGAGIKIAPYSGTYNGSAVSDKLNGATATTAAFTTPFFQVAFVSDGTGNWYYYVPPQGGGTSVPASATQTGIVSLGNQTLGAGVKTVQELATNSSIDLPSTVSQYTGVINQNGTPFIHSFGGYTNIFAGNGSGNFSLTAASAALNSGFGWGTLNSLTTGSQNSAFGSYAGIADASGYQNVYFGWAAGMNNIDGAGNCFIGPMAGVNSRGGSYSAPSSYNVMIGFKSGSNTSYNGSGNLFVGNYAGFYTANPSNTLVINNTTTADYGTNLINGNFATGQVQLNGGVTPTFTPSAALEVISGNKGLLQPKTSPYSIANPAEGLSVYDPNTHRPWYYNGARWSAASLPYTLFWDVGSYGSFGLADNSNNIIIKSGATSLTYITLNLPTTPTDGDFVILTFKLPATNVSYQYGTVYNPVTNFAANQQVTLQYNQASNTWY